jgi:hypothetical protein
MKGRMKIAICNAFIMGGIAFLSTLSANALTGEPVQIYQNVIAACIAGGLAVLIQLKNFYEKEDTIRESYNPYYNIRKRKPRPPVIGALLW